jgi:hypothetical protein
MNQTGPKSTCISASLTYLPTWLLLRFASMLLLQRVARAEALLQSATSAAPISRLRCSQPAEALLQSAVGGVAPIGLQRCS